MKNPVDIGRPLHSAITTGFFIPFIVVIVTLLDLRVMKYANFFLVLFFAPALFSQVPEQKDSVFADHLDSALMKMPDRSYRAKMFAGFLVGEKNERKARYYYELLKRDYADFPSTKKALDIYDLLTNSPMKVGKRIPSFEIPLLGGKGTVSDTSMLGRYYLLHFWATWMGCSVAEIPDLHKAYEKYAGKKGFQIISISFDSTAACVAPLYEKGWKLEDKWKMSWLHAFAPGVFKANGEFKSDLGVYESGIAKKFVILGIPRLYLIGPDGKILAEIADLFGDKLDERLGEYLGDSN